MNEILQFLLIFLAGVGFNALLWLVIFPFLLGEIGYYKRERKQHEDSSQNV